MDGSGLAVFYEVFVFRADALILPTRTVGLDRIIFDLSLDADIRQKHRTDFLFGLLHRHEERLAASLVRSRVRVSKHRSVLICTPARPSCRGRVLAEERVHVLVRMHGRGRCGK